jgi:large subunit ribosomal protein L3
MIGHYAKAGIAAGRLLNECRVDESELEGVNVGDELDLTRFEVGQKVDVVGQSKGKGFQGGVKRWNFAMQDATHGNSVSHRAPGSIGQCQTPGRVFKGKKMAGHMGSEQVTVQSLVVVRVDTERNLLLVKGNVPGAPGSNVLVRPAVKAHS